MANVTNFPTTDVRTFSTFISNRASLEVSYMDFDEDSQITSVIMVLDEHTANRKIRHITKKVFSSPRLLAFCNSQLKSYILLRAEDREPEDRWDIQNCTEEFTGIKLHQYQSFSNNY